MNESIRRKLHEKNVYAEKDPYSKIGGYRIRHRRSGEVLKENLSQHDVKNYALYGEDGIKSENPYRNLYKCVDSANQHVQRINQTTYAMPNSCGENSGICDDIFDVCVDRATHEKIVNGEINSAINNNEEFDVFG